MTLPLPLPLQGTETSVRRRFFGGSQASHNLLVTTVVGVSGAKAQERIEKLGAELFTCRRTGRLLGGSLRDPGCVKTHGLDPKPPYAR